MEEETFGSASRDWEETPVSQDGWVKAKVEGEERSGKGFCVSVHGDASEACARQVVGNDVLSCPAKYETGNLQPKITNKGTSAVDDRTSKPELNQPPQPVTPPARDTRLLLTDDCRSEQMLAPQLTDQASPPVEEIDMHYCIEPAAAESGAGFDANDSDSRQRLDDASDCDRPSAFSTMQRPTKFARHSCAESPSECSHTHLYDNMP